MNGQSGFPVEIVYFRPAERFAPLGYKATAFPVPDAPVSRLFWSMYLPDRYRFVHFGGDMEAGMLATPLNGLLGRARVNAEHVVQSEPVPAPALRDMGKKAADIRELSSRLIGGNAGVAVEEGYAAKQEAFEADAFAAQNVRATVAGVFPVAFDVPAQGQLFRFGQVMVVGQSPRVTMWYLHVGFLKAFGYLFVALGLWTAYRRRALLARWARLAAERLRDLEASAMRRLRPAL